jgi:hypothetical protein
VNVVLNMLAGESSESACTESVSAATGRVFSEDEGACSPGVARRKRLCRTGHSAVSAEGKKRKKRRLHRSSGLELGANSMAPVPIGGPTSANLEDDIESRGGTRVSGRVFDEGEEDEEEVSPLFAITTVAETSIMSQSRLCQEWLVLEVEDVCN